VKSTPWSTNYFSVLESLGEDMDALNNILPNRRQKPCPHPRSLYDPPPLELQHSSNSESDLLQAELLRPRRCLTQVHQISLPMKNGSTFRDSQNENSNTPSLSTTLTAHGMKQGLSVKLLTSSLSMKVTRRWPHFTSQPLEVSHSL
jgi:hypothetical protein